VKHAIQRALKRNDAKMVRKKINSFQNILKTKFFRQLSLGRSNLFKSYLQ